LDVLNLNPARWVSDHGTLLAFVRMSFKTNFAYRSAVFMGILGSLFSVLVQIAIWTFIFQKDPAMLSYMTAYVVLSQLLGLVYFDQITTSLGNKITTGDFVTDLIKPVNSILVYWSTALGITLATVLTRGLPILVIFSPALVTQHLDIVKIFFFLGLCGLGYLLLGLIYILVGHLAFMLTELWAFGRMLRDTISFFSGAVIPLAFFPAGLAWFTNLLPFRLLYSFPIRFLLEEMPISEIWVNVALLVIWIVGLSLVLKWVAQRAVWHSVAQGG
jgi:ABC-2 type transport system permease protein